MQRGDHWGAISLTSLFSFYGRSAAGPEFTLALLLTPARANSGVTIPGLPALTFPCILSPPRHQFSLCQVSLLCYARDTLVSQTKGAAVLCAAAVVLGAGSETTGVFWNLPSGGSAAGQRAEERLESMEIQADAEVGGIEG